MRSQLYEGIEYRDFWAGKSKASLDKLEHTLVGDLLPASGHRIIDIGCGFGRLADCYLDRFEQVVLLDGSMTLLRQAQESYKEKAVYVAADATRLPFSESSFDCALMMRVFHHLPNSQTALEGVGRILGKGGCFVFNYSNKMSARRLARRLVYFWRESPLSFEPVLSGRTLIQHHPAYVHQMLIDTGFSKMKYFGAGVMDKIAGRFGGLDGVSSGKALAALFGFIKLAPWIICKTQTDNGSRLSDEVDMEKVLACPVCHGPVTHLPNAYLCRPCGRSYPIEDGIADFRVDL